MIDHPAAVRSNAYPVKKKECPPPHPDKIHACDKNVVKSSVLSEAKTKQILALASPMPWNGIIGRINTLRIDLVDANKEMLCHFHPTNPKGEKTPNWENDMIAIIHMSDIIASQEQTIKDQEETINKLMEKLNGTN